MIVMREVQDADMSSPFSESVVEDTALAWFGAIDWPVAHGPEIAPAELAAERADLGQAVSETRVRETLAPKLFSGESRVKDAERFVAKAL